MQRYLICENCFQVVARFDDGDLSPTIVSDIFSSKFPPERQVRSPWAPGLPAKFMQCPVCAKRVFNDPDPDMLYVSDQFDGSEPHHLSLYTDVFKELDDIEPISPKDLSAICPVCGEPREHFSSIDNFLDHVEQCAVQTDSVRADIDHCPSCGRSAAEFKSEQGFKVHKSACAKRHDKLKE